VKPGDLVKIDGNRPMGHADGILEYYAMKETIFIVDKVELVEDPLGPTGNLFVTVVDPTGGGRWVIDGNVLVKIV
jgi:hypothetical protein